MVKCGEGCGCRGTYEAYGHGILTEAALELVQRATERLGLGTTELVRLHRDAREAASRGRSVDIRAEHVADALARRPPRAG